MAFLPPFEPVYLKQKSLSASLSSPVNSWGVRQVLSAEPFFTTAAPLASASAPTPTPSLFELEVLESSRTFEVSLMLVSEAGQGRGREWHTDGKAESTKSVTA